MLMLEDCIELVSRKEELSHANSGQEPDNDMKELYKSIYYHLSDYKDILNKSIELTNEITEISNRWELVKRANAKE